MGEEKTNRPLTPRRQLGAIVVGYAEAKGIRPCDAWREFARRYDMRLGAYRYTDTILYLKWSYCMDHGIPEMTLPAFIEETRRLDEAIAIAREMAGGAAA